MGTLPPPFPGDPIHTPSQDRAIGNVWRRIIAFAIDGLIVGIAGSAIAIPFFEIFSHLGPWGRLVGFCLTLPYFAILDSRICNGQTLGKRWLGLQVIDEHGNTISFSRSLARYALFALPYYLNGISLPFTRTPWIVSSLISVVVFALGGGTFYLVLFNRHTRQGIHDWLVGSYVADAKNTGVLKIQPIWKMHWVILGSLLAFFFVATGILSNKLTKWGAFPQMIQDVRLIENLKGVQQAGVQDLNWSDFGSGEKKKIFLINVVWTGKSEDEEAFADRVAGLVLQNDSNVQQHDLLRIIMIRGFDLGIAHAQVSHTFEHTPPEWKTRLIGKTPTEISTTPRLRFTAILSGGSS